MMSCTRARQQFALAILFGLASSAATTQGAIFLNNCPGDLDGDGFVGGADLAVLLAAWGTASPTADINGDGNVDGADLATLLAGWGMCPGLVRIDEPATRHTPPASPELRAENLITASPIAHQSATTWSSTSGVYNHSGEFYIEATDLHIAGRGLDFVWARKYRSRLETDTAIGVQWDFTYNIFLEPSGGDFIVHDGATRRDLYEFDPANNVWIAPEQFNVLEQIAGGFSLVFRDTGRWNFFDFTGAPEDGKLSEIIDRNGNTMSFEYDALGRLTTIHDTLDTAVHNRDITILYNPAGLIESVTDFAGRTVKYEYYDGVISGGGAGDLRVVTSPPVTGTPTNNDYPFGKTTTYTYSTGFADDRLNHNLLTITDGKGQTFLTNEYFPTLTVQNIGFDRVGRQQHGSVSDWRDRIYLAPPDAPDILPFATKVNINDRVGNVSEELYDDFGRLILQRDHTGRAPNPDAPTIIWTVQNAPTGPVRATDPPWFETLWEWNADSLATRVIDAEQSETLYVYDSSNPERRSQANVLERRSVPGPRGASQPVLIDLYIYDPFINFGTNFVTSHTDPRGSVTEQFYDPQGNLVQRVNRLPTIVEDFSYNAFGQMTSRTHPEILPSVRRTDLYDYYGPADGVQNGYLRNVVVDATGFGIVETIVVDEYGRTIQEIDPKGNADQRVYNALDQLVVELSRPVGPAQYETLYFYDANDNLVRRCVSNHDENGFLDPLNSYITQIYEYDILDFVTREVSEVGSFNVPLSPPQLDATGLPDSEFVTVEYEYDNNKNVVRRVSGEAAEGRQPTNSVEYVYDERDLVFQSIKGSGDPDQSTTEYTYDANGNTIRVEQGLEALASGGTPRLTLFTYDGYDRLVSSIDPMGNETVYLYDPNHNLTNTRLFGELSDTNPGGGGNVLLFDSTIFYDPMDRVELMRVQHFDPNSGVSIGDGLSETQLIWYDTGHLRLVIDDNANATSYEYDTAHRPFLLTDAKGNTVTSFYDANSNLVQSVSTDLSDIGAPPQTFVTTYVYDNLDRRIVQIDNVGNSSEAHYDSRNNIRLEFDADGNTTRHTYDGLNRLVQTVRDLTDTGTGAGVVIDQIITNFQYDDNDRVVLRIDGEANATEYEYDALDRLIQERGADNTIHAFTYDPHHNRETTIDPNGTFLQSTYDFNNRLVQNSVSVGPGVSFDTSFEFLEYDGLNRLTRAEDDDSIVEFQYDSMSNQITETLRLVPAVIAPKTTLRTYDGVGNRISVIYPSGDENRITYDALYNPTLVEFGTPPLLSPVVDFSYVGQREEERIYANGVTTFYQYDGILGLPNAPGDFGFKHPTSMFHTGPLGPIADVTFTWTPRQNKANRSLLRPGAGPSNGLQINFDSFNRISGAIQFNGGGGDDVVTIHAHDRAGNRQASVGVDRPGIFIQDPTTPAPADKQVNQYTETPSTAQTHSENGAVTEQVSKLTPILRTLTPDFRDRYVDIGNGFVNTEMRYDALGRLVATTVNSVAGANTRFFALDGPDIVEEYDNTGSLQRQYIRGENLDEMLSMREPGAEYFYHADDQGSILSVTDAAGFEVEQWDYTLSGRPFRSVFQQEPNQNSAAASDNEASPFSGDVQVIADNFATNGEPITGLSWFGAYASLAPAPLPVDQFTIQIYEDGGGVPGLLVFEEIVGEVSRAPTGAIIAGGSLDEYNYRTSFTTPFLPVAGTQYWLVIVANTFGDPNVWAWETSSGGDGLAAFALNGAPFAPAGADFAFRLHTDHSIISNPYRYIGRRYEQSNGLYFMRARWYDPAMGRFLTPDPSGTWSDWRSVGNRFTYAANNPATFADPMGRAAFAKYDGIKGEAKDANHDKWIDVLSFNADGKKPGAGATGAARRRGDVILEDITCVKEMDKASIKLQEACANGTFFKEVEIHFCTTSKKDKQEPYLTYTLKDCIITSYSTGGSGGDDKPSEDISFGYTEIEWTYKKNDSKGSKKGNVEATWKIEEGEAAATSKDPAPVKAGFDYRNLELDDANWRPHITPYGADGKPYPRLDKYVEIRDFEPARPFVTPYGADGKPYVPPPIRDLPLWQPARPHITPYGADGLPAGGRGGLHLGPTLYGSGGGPDTGGAGGGRIDLGSSSCGTGILGGVSSSATCGGVTAEGGTITFTGLE